jgi:hypothetical protein
MLMGGLHTTLSWIDFSFDFDFDFIAHQRFSSSTYQVARSKTQGHSCYRYLYPIPSDTPTTYALLQISIIPKMHPTESEH